MAGPAGPAAPDPSLGRTEHRLRTQRALSDVKRHLGRRALKLVGYVVVAYLGLRLVPTLKQALHSLQRVSWEWVVAAIALEVLSETGFVVSWRAIVDPDRLLEQDGRGWRMDQRVAWAQLGGGLLVPGGSLGGMGVGGWILHRFGMPTKLIAERQFNLSFLNTAIDALALIVFGLGLAAGVFPGESNLLLTLLPASLAAAGIAAALLIGPRAGGYAERLHDRHPKIGGALTTLADAVDDTKLVFLRRELARDPHPPNTGFRRRPDGIHNRSAWWLTSASREPRDDRRHRRHAHCLRGRPQPRRRRRPAPPSDWTARAAGRRCDRLRDHSPHPRTDPQ